MMYKHRVPHHDLQDSDSDFQVSESQLTPPCSRGGVPTRLGVRDRKVIVVHELLCGAQVRNESKRLRLPVVNDDNASRVCDLNNVKCTRIT